MVVFSRRIIGQKKDEGQGEGVWLRSSYPDHHHFFYPMSSLENTTIR